MKRIGVIAILILAFGGLADSLYLTQNELSGTPLLCNIQNLSDCNIVATSQYSRIFGLPLAEFGVFFYGILFVLAALELVIFNKLLRRMLQVVAVFGVISSLYFTFLQVFVISAFCIYCFASALIALLILVFASLIEPIQKRESSILSQTPQSPKKSLSMPPTV